MGSACQLLLQSYPSPCLGEESLSLYPDTTLAVSAFAQSSHSEWHSFLLLELFRNPLESPQNWRAGRRIEAQKENRILRHNINTFLSQVGLQKPETS